MPDNSWTPIAMQTGFSSLPSETPKWIQKIKGIMMHFMERAVWIGSEYANASGRDIVTSTDILYALQYQARTYLDYVTNTANIESLFDKYVEESGDEESDDQGSDDEESDDQGSVDEGSDDEESDDEDLFTRCDNPPNDLIKDMNMYHDTWEDWNPDNLFQQILKNAVNQTCVEKCIP
jgi:cobalamin biosynthesis protein CobT